MSKDSLKISKSLVLKPQASAPTSPENGEIYYDSTLNQFRKYENGVWAPFAVPGAITINDTDFTIRDATDSSKHIVFDAAGSASTTTTIASSQTANRTVTLPDATTTLLGNNASQTVTNKDIDGGTASDTSRITLPKASKSTLDGLTRKQATIVYASDLDKVYVDDGSVLKEIGSDSGGSKNYLSSITTSNGTNTGNGNFELGTTTGWSLFNTTLTYSYKPTFTTVTLGAIQIANASVKLGDPVRFTTTGTLPTGYALNTTYYVSAVGPSSFFVSATLGGTSLFATGGSGTHTVLALPTVSGSISAGAVSVTTFNTVSSGQLAGSYSLQTASSAAWSQGQGFLSDAFYIDTEDQAKALSFSLNYKFISGSTNAILAGTIANTFIPVIYDVTNSVWIQPSGVFGITTGSGSAQLSGQFQSSSNGTQYRVGIVALNPTIGAVTLYWDDFSVGPTQYVYGSPITDLQDYGTITIGATTTAPTKGTTAIDRIQAARVGDNWRVRGEYRQTTAGTGGSGDYLFTLPNGLKFDSNKVSFYTTVIGAGTWSSQVSLGSASGTDGNSSILGVVLPYDATRFRIGTLRMSGSGYDRGIMSSSAMPLTGSTWALSFDFMAPILGYSSSTQMSDSADTRVLAASYTKTANQSVTANTTDITFPNAIFDTHGAFDGTTFRAPTSGYYQITGAGLRNTTAVAAGIFVYVNGTLRAQAGSSNSNGGDRATLSALLFLNSGDALTIRSDTTATLSAGTGVSDVEIQFHRLSGPSAIAATETIAASYYCSANQSVSTTQPINFDTKEYDTHGAVTTGSGWRFTAPAAGLYNVIGNISPTTAVTHFIRIRKNGSTYKSIGEYVNGTIGVVACDIKLNAGEYIDFTISSSASVFGSASLSTDQVSTIAIKRVGIF